MVEILTYIRHKDRNVLVPITLTGYTRAATVLRRAAKVLQSAANMDIAYQVRYEVGGCSIVRQ